MKFPNTTMSRVKTHFPAASGLAILVFTIALLSRGHSTAQAPRDCPGVSICNTDAQPVPIRWAGTASVPVHWTGTEAQPVPVQWTGTARVEVTNVDAQPIPVSGAVDVRSPVSVQTSPREPIHVVFLPRSLEDSFFAQGTVGLRPGDNSVLFSPPGFEVPAGKILRLQHVSADIDMANAFQVPQVGLKIHPQQPNPFPLAEVQKGFSPQWSINQSLPSLPVQPGVNIEIQFQRIGNTAGQATLTLALAGELQDSP